MIKYTRAFLNKLEDLFTESDYVLRYEKGNFKSGYCVLKDTRIILVNNFYPLEGKINCLLEIIRTVPLATTRFSEKNKKLLAEVLSMTDPDLFAAPADSAEPAPAPETPGQQS